MQKDEEDFKFRILGVGSVFIFLRNIHITQKE